MATHEFPGDPTGQAVFDALLTAKVPPKEAYNASQWIRDMAWANLDAKIESLRRELNALKWFTGPGVAILATLMALLR